jgi:hypothetical protein
LAGYALLLVGCALLGDAWVGRAYGDWGHLFDALDLEWRTEVSPLFWPRGSFDRARWAETDAGERYRFARAIIEGRLLIGRTPEEVAALLGGEPRPGLALYRLRPAPPGDRWWVLVVHFAGGRADRVTCEVAWLDPA